MVLEIAITVILVYVFIITASVYRYFMTWLFKKNWFLGLYEHLSQSKIVNIPIETKILYEVTCLDNHKKLLNYTITIIIYLVTYLLCFIFICIFLILRHFDIINHRISYLDSKVFSNVSILHLLIIISAAEMIFQYKLLISILIKSWKWTVTTKKKINQITAIENYKIKLTKDIDLSKFNINSRKNYYIYSIKIDKFSPKSIVKVDFEYFKQKYGLELTKNLFETFFWLIENNKIESKSTFSYLDNLKILYLYNLTQFK